MSFCATCGRQRNGTAQFCGGCGTEFSDPPDAPAASVTSAAPGDGRTQPANITHLEGLPAGVTRMDLDPAAPGAVHPDPAPAEPDPFADWYSPPASAAAAGAAGYGAEGQWQPTETVRGGATQATGYPPPSAFSPAPAPPPAFPPAPPAFPPAPQGAPPSRGGGRKGLFIVVAVVVVLAAGGGAYALASSLGKHSTAQPPTQPTVGASTPAAGTTPASGGSASASASPSPTLSLVAVSPGVTASAAEPQVETLLSHYFHGINTHDYAEYASTLTAQQQANEPQSAFDSGYSSTTDSGMALTSLIDGSGGGLTATVTFTSRQSPAQSVDKSACNAWTLNLSLVSQGTGYLIGPAPSGYQPTYSDC
jgi:hypothetical protein